MLRAWLNRLKEWWRPTTTPPAEAPSPADILAGPLQRLVLSEEVRQTLFDSYQSHRRSPRGHEEIGWVLLGIRQGPDAIALAVLPAGTQREAGIAHVQFNPDAQELASRILRQTDKRLTMIAVVHTHPGNLRKPSDGDYQGDVRWVEQLRGDGVFGIGTADAQTKGPASLADNQQTVGELCFSWYALGKRDADYRPLPVHVTPGSDLAVPLQEAWDLLETYAGPLNRLCRQLARVQFEFAVEASDKYLIIRIPLASTNQQLRLLLNEAEARYYWDRQDELIAIDPEETQVDRAVYLILAEIAKESSDCEKPISIES